MSHMMNKYLLIMIPCLCLLSACVAPQAQAPQATAEEIRQEQAAQRAQVNYVKVPLSSSISKTTERRFRDAAGRIMPAAKSMCADLKVQDCRFFIELKRGQELNAYADGERIYINSAMVNFAQTDAELAHVIAHEWAHNMMAHVNALQTNTVVGALFGLAVDMAAASQGYDTGGEFGRVGAQIGQLRYSTSFEKEADYIGLYISARAGYQVEQAPELWRRMTAQDERGLYAGGTHPSNPERYVAMQRAIAEIQAKQASNRPLLPEFKPAS